MNLNRYQHGVGCDRTEFCEVENLLSFIVQCNQLFNVTLLGFKWLLCRVDVNLNLVDKLWIMMEFP